MGIRHLINTKIGACILALVILGTSSALTSCAAGSRDAPAVTASSPLKAWIGMTIDDLKKIYPDLAVDNDVHDRWIRKAEEFGLSGTWTYSFTGNKLRWFVFNSYQNDVNKPNFTAYLQATDSIIESYKDVLGQPVKVRSGIQTFNDPAIKPHNGYLVEQVTWNSDIGKIKVDFSFLGENKTYEFLLSVQVSS